MKFKQGKSGNPNGRPNGSGNKDKAMLRSQITNFLESNFDKIIEDVKTLETKDRVKFYIDLLNYGLPRLSTVTLDEKQDNCPPIVFVDSQEVKDALEELC